MTDHEPFPGHDTVAAPRSQEADILGRRQVTDPGHQGLDLLNKSVNSERADTLGALETCIINAAIIGTNWPHKAGKKTNKPVVVDMQLPVN